MKTDNFEMKYTYTAVENNNAPGKCFGARHIQVFILFLVYLVNISIRNSIGIAIVAMNAKEYETETFRSPEWDPITRHRVMSSFYYGYMLLQVPSGQLAHRFGAKFLIVASLGSNSLLAFLIPFGVKYGGWKLMIGFRFVQGLTQAFLVPSIHTLLGKWVPLEERGRLGAFVYGATALGSALGPLISGIVGTYFGWPAIFFFFGFILAMIFGVWTFVGSESPAHHKNIDPQEKLFIQTQLGQDDKLMKSRLPVPWGAILTSPATWAIVFAHIGNSWGAITLSIVLPTYLSKVMDIDIKSNGILNALPFFLMWLGNFGFSYLADKLIEKKLLSVTATRKIANTIGTWPTAAAIVGMAFVPKGDITTFEILFVLTCLFKIAAHVGFHVNHIDVSPNFAGTLISISNFSSNLFSSFAPTVAGMLVASDEHNIYLWRRVFFVTAAIFFFTNLLYIIFGSGKRASWNETTIKLRKSLTGMETVIE